MPACRFASALAQYRTIIRILMIDETQVQKLAQLARLGLTPDEVKKFTHQLDDILGFFEKLEEVDTTGVEPVAQITGLSDVTRPDEVHPSEIADELLACSPLGVTKNHIRAQKTL